VDSLQQVGAARSIVIDEDNVILAGNGTVDAAGEAGIERVRIIEADGHELIAVRRRGLSVEQKRRLALADNRSAELAEWDYAELQRQMKEIEAAGGNVLTIGWTQDELDPILNSVFQPGGGTSPLDEGTEQDGVGGAKMTFSAGQWRIVSEALEVAKADMPGSQTDVAALIFIAEAWLASKVAQ